MNYNGLLAQSTGNGEAMMAQRGAPVEAKAVAVITLQTDAVEEEPPAMIQTFQLARSATLPNNSNLKTETTTAQRKTSSRFINALQQFYAATSNVASNYSTSTATASAAAATTAATHDASSSTTEEQQLPTSHIVQSGRAPSKGVESKLLSMWHNVKYGWNSKMKSNFSKEQPVWLLGRCYHRKSTPPSSMETSMELNGATSTALDSTNSDAAPTITLLHPTMIADETYNKLYPRLDALQLEDIVAAHTTPPPPQELGMDAAANQMEESPWEEGIEGFRRDFYSRLWMTYRREFPIMNGSNYTSDCGWGCMLRSGQMLLAQALVCHFLGRSWRYDPDTQLNTTYEDTMHRKIIKWFGDSSSRNSPFSIHALVSLGQEEMGKKPGDWYGPASVSYLLKQALRNASQENADFDNIAIYVAKDSTIYLQDIENECCIPEQNSIFLPWKIMNQRPSALKAKKPTNRKAVIILIPLRLGAEKLNAVYVYCLKMLLSMEHCIGIIGGRPKHSLYFVGFQEDKLIHLDPHYCQEMVDVNQENFPVHSFHCKSPRKLKTTKMDPSCCIGFYCQTKVDLEKFIECVQLYLNPMSYATGGSSIEKVIPLTGNLDNLTEINYPLFTFSRGRCSDHERSDEMKDSLYKSLHRQLIDMRKEIGAATSNDHHGDNNDDDDDDDEYGETEEFVLL